jgi:RNA polymerase sigma factor (sigma-70 family)
MSATDRDLLGQFVRDQSQDAFTALVNRHLNLVYSAALRQVRSPQLAEEVSQSVFTQLARDAAKLDDNLLLTGWLYQVACNAAIDVVRREARRQAREQIALQMNETNDSPAAWAQVEPLLDKAMESLENDDRAAVLLRFFENKSLREVGEAIGVSEDAAQKRVSRAVERLRESLGKRKVTVGASVLAALVSANAVQSAPAGLAGILASSALASSAISSATPVAITKTIAMTTLQKTIITTIVSGALVIGGLYGVHRLSKSREEVGALKVQQDQETAALRGQVQELERQRDAATNAMAALSSENESLKKHPTEVLKLRGEVGKLRQENASLGSSSALSKVTADPESRQLLRKQQKLGMGMIYTSFAKQLKLQPEQIEKLSDLLADHIMDNVDHVTTALRDKTPSDQLAQLFSGQDTALREKLEALLGVDGVAQYQDYTHNLLATLTADQFKGDLEGTKTEQADKATQLQQLIQQELQSAIRSAGLAPDYQTLPILNFGNIASEQEADRSLKLVQDIYSGVAARAGTFLSPAEITKFQEFEAKAINNSRAALTLNRNMMAPISK